MKTPTFPLPGQQQLQVPLTSRHVRFRRARGFTLVELMMGVSILGVLATLGTHTIRSHLASAKSLEAVSMLGTMGSNAVASSSQLEDRGLEMGRTIAFGDAVVAAPDNGNGKKDTWDDGNNGHGNSDGCDPTNPGNSGKCDGAGTGNGNSGNGADTGDVSNGNGKKDTWDDGNNGHGNSDGCDPTNPGNSGKCDGSGSGSDGGGSSGGGSAGPGDSGAGQSGGSGSEAGERVRLCGTAEPVPPSVEAVRGRRYQSSPAAWRSGDADNGWSCLRMSRSEPQHYQYGYDVGGSKVSGADGGSSGTTFTAWARGDLDGDGRSSWFTLEGGVVDGQIVTAPSVNMIDPEE